MKEKLIEIEKQIENYSTFSNLSNNELLVFPETVRQVHLFKVFGDNLLSIPHNFLIKGHESEFEIPFSFLSEKSTLEIFESEFRSDIPNEFIQIGNLNGLSEIVLLNVLTNNIHVFHVSDVVDKEWLNYKLFEKTICDFETLIDNIRPQTVCCFINPKNLSEYDIFEIRDNSDIKYDDKILKFESTKQAMENYKMLVLNSIEKGFDVHFAPKSLLNELKNKV